MEKATILHVGEFWEDFDGPERPLIQFWHTEGGDYPGVDGRAVTEDDPLLGGWSKRELRAMAQEAGTYYPRPWPGPFPPDGMDPRAYEPK